MEGLNQQVVSAETSARTRYRGIGGWLLLFIVSLTIITPALHGYIAYHE
jgi:hypothetical protein